MAKKAKPQRGAARKSKLQSRDQEPRTAAIEQHIKWRKACAAIKRLQTRRIDGVTTRTDLEELAEQQARARRLEPLPRLTRTERRILDSGSKSQSRQRTTSPARSRPQPTRIRSIVSGGAPTLGKRR